MMLDLDPIKKRWEAATKGEWKHYSGKLRPQFPVRIHEIQDAKGAAIVKWSGFDGVSQPAREIKANASFIAHAHQDIPALVAEVERLREALKDAEETIKGHFDDNCDECRAGLASIQKALGGTNV